MNTYYIQNYRREMLLKDVCVVLIQSYVDIQYNVNKGRAVTQDVVLRDFTAEACLRARDMWDLWWTMLVCDEQSDTGTGLFLAKIAYFFNAVFL